MGITLVYILNPRLHLEASSDFKLDGIELRCRSCHRKRSVRIGSFFENRRLSLRSCMKLLIDFCADVPGQAAAKVHHIHSNSVYNFYKDCRQRMGQMLRENPVTFNDWVYECDEKSFNNVADAAGIRRRMVVFGIYERYTGKVYLRRVVNRRRVTIEPIIREKVEEGQVVMTDEHGAYYHLGDLEPVPYINFTVNHRQGDYSHVDDVVSGDGEIEVTTNSLEGIWSQLKGRMIKRTRRNYRLLDEYLDEFMFRQH